MSEPAPIYHARPRGRPRGTVKPKTKRRLSVRLNDEVFARLDAYVLQQEISLTRAVEDAIAALPVTNT